MKKRTLIALILFFFLSTFISQKNLDFFSRFEVKEIFIENNQILSDEDVRKELSFLYKKNLFSLKIKKIDQVLDKNTFPDYIKEELLLDENSIVTIEAVKGETPTHTDVPPRQAHLIYYISNNPMTVTTTYGTFVLNYGDSMVFAIRC